MPAPTLMQKHKLWGHISRRSRALEQGGAYCEAIGGKVGAGTGGQRLCSQVPSGVSSVRNVRASVCACVKKRVSELGKSFGGRGPISLEEYRRGLGAENAEG